MILCAAIKVIYELDHKESEVVLAGSRHPDIWATIAVLSIQNKRKQIEGFIDQEGNFLDRYDAFEHAVMCGQVSRTTLDHKEERFEVQLYSEDLY